jgi:hypothetical protein
MVDVMNNSSRTGDYSLIETGKLKPTIKDGKLHLTVMAESINKLSKPAAKTFAYDQRFNHGMQTAGIEQETGPMPVNDKGTPVEGQSDKHSHYAVTFKLTPGL